METIRPGYNSKDKIIVIKFIELLRINSDIHMEDIFKDIPNELFNLFELFSNKTIEKGLYRIHSFKSSKDWALLISEYFTKYENKIYPFGFDWMGRQFCLSKSNNNILMFDPATGEDFELEQNLIVFHNEELINETESILSISLFKEVLSYYKKDELDYNECFGYKIPLFLGGSDNIENYEKQDIEVYWHMKSQLFKKVKNLPGGTNIRQINIK